MLGMWGADSERKVSNAYGGRFSRALDAGLMELAVTGVGPEAGG